VSGQQPRQSALLRLGYTGRGAGRGSQPWRGARRGFAIPQNTAQYGAQSFTRGRRGWRGRGGAYYTAQDAPTNTPYYRGLMEFIDCNFFFFD